MYAFVCIYLYIYVFIYLYIYAYVFYSYNPSNVYSMLKEVFIVFYVIEKYPQVRSSACFEDFLKKSFR